MEVQVLAPAMEHPEEAEFHAQTLGCGGEQGLGGGVKEDAIDDFFVVEGDGGDGLGEGEDHVEILGGQQFGSAVLEPVFARQALALGAVTVAARTVLDVGDWQWSHHSTLPPNTGVRQVSMACIKRC